MIARSSAALYHASQEAATGTQPVVIEHNLDVCKAAYWIIDLGLKGGEDGGCLVVEGTPEKVVAAQASYTGQFLRWAAAR